jgi:hypothetical protein
MTPGEWEARHAQARARAEAAPKRPARAAIAAAEPPAAYNLPLFDNEA